MAVGDRLEKWRNDAESCCSLFASRYSSGGVGFEYIRIAQRWRDALCHAELDPNELRAVIAEAERYKYRCDIAFYGFINDMRSIYHDLWEEHLSQGPLPGGTKTVR